MSGVEVLDVYRRGTVAVHFLAGELQPGSVVRQSIDWNRRFDNMQQHSGGQYLPSPPPPLLIYLFYTFFDFLYSAMCNVYTGCL